MRPNERRETGQTDLFRARLDQIVDPTHALVKLAATIDWRFLEERLGAVYDDDPGRPPLPTRLMAGLAILKHLHDLSDEVLASIGSPIAVKHPRASVAVTWAALDCIGGWAGDLTERLMVLGRMTARVDDLPVIGEPHVVVGEGRGREGRKTFTAATLYDADRRVVASAEHIWIAVDPALFGGQRPSD